MRSLMIRAWWRLQGIMNSSINWKCWQYSIKRPTGRSWTCSSSWICSLNNGVIWIEMTRLWWVSDICNNLWNFSQFYFLYHTVFWGDTGRIRYGSLFKKFFKKNIFSTNVAGATQASFFSSAASITALSKNVMCGYKTYTAGHIHFHSGSIFFLVVVLDQNRCGKFLKKK